ncbi:MAG: Ig-like domain-containing protein, partial [Chloroflexi bacterium]|nr:Ig-like domain-containing protein [Chloroflexota bacterium]
MGSNSTPIHDLKFDVFPATLDGFMSLTDRGGGLALAWDKRFETLADADGDGLLANVRYGIDPNDALPDTDGDGLSDSFELERRQAGIALSPILRDSDGDGLTDKQEMEIGSNAGVADTDNDGLSDGQEVWHQVYDANGVATSTFEGGWDVTINGASNIAQHVSSNPNQADSDADGVSDQAERQLALDANPANRLDNQNRPYHPNVPNAPPLAVYAASDDADGFVSPGQPVIYTTTVVANVAVAPGVLQVTTPAQFSVVPGPYALAFNPATFTSTQTMVQQTNLTVAGDASAGPLALNSTAQVRLPNTAASGWVFDPVVAQAPLSGFVAPFKARFHSLNPSRVDRQDSYFLSGLAGPSAGEFDIGDIRTYGLPAGTAQVAETSAIAGGQFFLRGFTQPDSAVNNRNDSLVVWDHIDRCNTIIINSLRVVTAGADASPGIEPFITLSTDNSTKNENVWLWTTGGGTGDMTANQQRGPNAFGFPITRTICDDTRLQVYESDGPLNDPAQQQLVAQIVTDPFIDRNNETLTFTGAGHTIQVNVTVPVRDAFVIGGSLVGPDGLPKRPMGLSRPAGLTADYKTLSRGPVVASNGDSFLVAYETYAEPRNPASTARDVYVAVQAFDWVGNPLGSSVRFVATQNPATGTPTRIGLDVAWVGDRYKVVVQPWGRPWIVAGDFSATGASLGNWSDVDGIFGNTTLNSPPSIAYNPANGHWAVAYVRAPSVIGTAVRVVEYANGGSMTESANQVIVGNFKQAKVTYHPPSEGWLVAGLDDSNQLLFQPMQGGLANLTASQTALAGASTIDSSLACPAAPSAALVDLRFEELPGATSFADASGGANNATCSAPGGPPTCPAAGLGGAPNASLSDYAVQFDGVDDFLTVNRSVPDSFTVAFWLKAPPAAVADMLLLDQGANGAGGFAVWLSQGRPGLLINTAESIVSAGRVDDNQWHFVAATRNRNTGAVALYVDGNPTPVASNIFATTALNAVNDSRISGDRTGNRDFKGTMDQLQIFPVALGGDAIQAIYNRTLQSYCVAAHANATQAGFQWAKLNIRQQDVRGGRLTASGGLSLTVDTDAPIASVTAPLNNSYIQGGNPAVTIIGGSASDLTTGVGKVEINVNNSGWQLATGDEAWGYPLAVTEGPYTIQARATDAAGTVGAPSPAITVIADATAPDLTLNNLGTTPIVPTRTGDGQWTVNLAGTVSDPARAGQPGSGLAANGVEVFVESNVVGSLPNSRQTAAVTGNNWSLAYTLNDVADPTGVYTVTVISRDNVGNRTADVRGRLLLDATAPIVSLSQMDATRTVISNTVTISGLVTDTGTIPGSSAGIDQVEIAFTPAEQIAALPAGLIGDAAEAQLNRTWVAVTLAQRGAGVATSGWRYQLPAGLEGEYQIDFRSTDMLGNRRITPNNWRGMIDTSDPRLVMTAEMTGASFVDNSGVRHDEVHFLCAAVDRNLDAATFTCPGEGQAEPIRTFADIPGLQSLFPDLTIRNGLAISYTLWTATPNAQATMSACDSLGRCASTAATPTQAANIGGALQSHIIAPAANSFVAGTNAISVTLTAEAAVAIKAVTISLDNTVVQTLTFAQNEIVTNILRTVTIPVANEGPHTLVTQATDWTGATQTTLFPVTFTLDSAPPNVAIDASVLTVADTWQPESGILRFNGTANDTIGLATVQVRVDDGAFVDAAFANGAWQTAIHVQDPEGRTLMLTVRASDLAGRVTEITQAIGTDLSAADAPDTAINSGPANPSPDNLATFGFTGTANAVAFDCQLDDGAYLPCVSPTSYADLSKGAHTFHVRAIDDRGFADVTPAEVVWTVTSSALDVTLTQTPANPTTSRRAEFHFTGNGASFQCSLDNAAFGS